MAPLRIALLCALVVSVSSAAVAQDGELPHWKPGEKTLAKLDFAFRNASEWHGSPPGLEPYNRFYAGVTIKGRRMIRAEFAQLYDSVDCSERTERVPPICLAAPRKGGIHIVPEDQFPQAKGGGCSFVDMSTTSMRIGWSSSCATRRSDVSPPPLWGGRRAQRSEHVGWGERCEAPCPRPKNASHFSASPQGGG